MNGQAYNPTNQCLSYANLAAGTTTTLSTTGATDYAIRGKMYQAAAKTNAATPTLDANTGAAFRPVTAGFGCVFIVCLDAAGALNVYQSSIERIDATGAFQNGPQYSALPNHLAPIGWLSVKAGPTAVGSWTFGSSNNSGVTGITYAFQNLNVLPDRPLVP